MKDQFLISIALLESADGLPSAYPFTIPAVRGLGTLEFSPGVTFFVGENGSGKSTLVEAIAVALGLNAEGGSRNFNFATRASHSPLHAHLRIARGVRRPQDSFFLRAESYFNVATEIENLDKGPGGGSIIGGYGGISLHEQSHGESFFALLRNRFRAGGLYILDEPEAALSPTRQLTTLRILHDLVRAGSQFIIATHSPILLGYPGARIYQLSPEGIHPIAYEQTEHYEITRLFLTQRRKILRELLDE
jgi:predicted ATPase